MLHRFSVYVLCLFIAVLPGCGILSPEQKVSLRQAAQQQYEDGTITAAQRDTAIEAIDNDQPFDWTTFGLVGLNIVMALLGAPAIVRMQRGAPTQKVGLPASKVKSA